MPSTRDYFDLTKKCFINAPFERLHKDLLDLFLKHRLQPEIGLEGNCLWERPGEDFARIARLFSDQGLDCTLHAPFHDLVPGGFDKKMVELSRKKLLLAFELIAVFKPQSIVCHLGFEHNKHGSHIERWLETSVATWTRLIRVAEAAGTRVMFENTYETDPEVHRQLLTALNSETVGFCLDTGHLTAFAGTGWQPWLQELGPWLGQLHLHDNDGNKDSHIAVGEGIFDFQSLFAHLRQRKLSPLITLEPHSREDLRLCLENIWKMKLFDGIK